MSNIVASAGEDTEEEEVFELIAENEDLRDVEARRGPRHTAERIYKHDRQRYDMIVTALRGGASITLLSRSHRVGTWSIYAIIDKAWGSRKAFHAELAERCRSVARMGIDRMAEIITEEKNLMAASIAVEKMMVAAQMLDGAPQLRVDVNIRHDHSDLIDKLNAAQALMRQARGVVLEAESGTAAGRVELGECVLPDGSIPAAVPAAVPERKEAA